MILDASLVFADAQAVTVTGASSNYVDTLAAGQAYVGLIAVMTVGTTFTAGGAATMTVDIQTDDNSSFSSPTTLVTLGTTVAVASLVAYYSLKKRLPINGVERYLRAYFTVATGPMTAGAVSVFLVKDADVPMA